MLAEEVRHHLARLGARTVGEIIGRADLLEVVDHPVGERLGALLVRAEGKLRHPGFRRFELSTLSARIVHEAGPALEEPPRRVHIAYPISNEDRTIGARLAGEIARRYGDVGLPDGTVDLHLSGTAGQSLGAWLTGGISLRLNGTANDYVGKGMGGGLIVVTPRRAEGVPHAAGNAVLYGATGGRAFLAGNVGQRFAVRNSGASAVVEGCSDHGCEYMTGGVAVVLGRIGRNFGAGMTGGVAFVWDPERMLPRLVADTSPPARRLFEDEGEELSDLIEEHARLTSSPVAAAILTNWEKEQGRFWVLRTSRPAVVERVDALGAAGD